MVDYIFHSLHPVDVMLSHYLWLMLGIVRLMQLLEDLVELEWFVTSF
jgi:hypothetical protein